MAFTINEEKSYNGIPLSSQYYRIAATVNEKGEITARLKAYPSETAYQENQGLKDFKVPCTKYRYDPVVDQETGEVQLDEDENVITYRNEWPGEFLFDRDTINTGIIIGNESKNYLEEITNKVVEILVEMGIISDITNVAIEL